jgi:hypothetical protein
MSIEYPCPVCKAKPKQACINTLHAGDPLPGRDEHFARALPPDRPTKGDE